MTPVAVSALWRLMKQTWAQRHGGINVLALDWQRAFDSIDPSAMVIGLRRFGLPEHVLEIIKASYTDRRFQVCDCDTFSLHRPQLSGISQGCPLSPFLFVMIMTIVMKDAEAQLTAMDRQSLKQHNLGALLYADDTLVMDADNACVQYLVNYIHRIGAEYGLQFNWGKLEILNLKMDPSVDLFKTKFKNI